MGGGVRKFIWLTRGGGSENLFGSLGGEGSELSDFLQKNPRVLYVGNPPGIYTLLHVFKNSFTFVIVRIMLKHTFWMSVIYIY